MIKLVMVAPRSNCKEDCECSSFWKLDAESSVCARYAVERETLARIQIAKFNFLQ